MEFTFLHRGREAMPVWVRAGRYAQRIYGEADEPESGLGSADDSEQRLSVQGSSDRGQKGEARSPRVRSRRGHSCVG